MTVGMQPSRETWEHINGGFLATGDWARAMAERTATVDGLVAALAGELLFPAVPGPVAVLAVGGYEPPRVVSLFRYRPAAAGCLRPGGRSGQRAHRPTAPASVGCGAAGKPLRADPRGMRPDPRRQRGAEREPARPAVPGGRPRPLRLPGGTPHTPAAHPARRTGAPPGTAHCRAPRTLRRYVLLPGTEHQRDPRRNARSPAHPLAGAHGRQRRRGAGRRSRRLGVPGPPAHLAALPRRARR